MDPYSHYSNPFEELRTQVQGLPAEIAALREQLAPPQFRAEVQRILTTLNSQVAAFKAHGRNVDDLEAILKEI